MRNFEKNKIFWAAIALVMVTVPAIATEGGLGRTIPGASGCPHSLPMLLPENQ